jgi:hypothetical protein
MVAYPKIKMRSEILACSIHFHIVARRESPARRTRSTDRILAQYFQVLNEETEVTWLTTHTTRVAKRGDQVLTRSRRTTRTPLRQSSLTSNR